LSILKSGLSIAPEEFGFHMTELEIAQRSIVDTRTFGGDACDYQYILWD
jgi:hypothetical protein